MDMEPKRMKNIDPISPNERAVVECFRKIKGRIRLTKFFGREKGMELSISGEDANRFIAIALQSYFSEIHKSQRLRLRSTGESVISGK